MFYGLNAVLNPIPFSDNAVLDPSSPRPPTSLRALSTR
jgi:hypothetical protein